MWTVLAALAIAGLVAAALHPGLYAAAILACVGASLCLILAAYPEAAMMGWLLAVASMPDLWGADVWGVGAGSIVAATKTVGLALAGVLMLRTGARLDPFNPGLAFVAMAAASAGHGLHPRLDAAESARSVLGSIAPFAFGMVRGTRGLVGAIIGAAQWGAPGAVLFGAGLDAAGLHPWLTDNYGLRLAGSGHPAFLAGFAITGVYASLTELLRRGDGRYLALLSLNGLILVGSGARAPLAIAALVVALAFVCVPSSAFPRARRLPLVLGGLLGIAALMPLAGALSGLRLFALLDSDADNLSGRELIWPLFQQAWAESPLWGWGVGAGKMLVPLDSLVARLLGTTAAHNEYFRVGVDGGYAGLVLLGALLALWAWWQVRRAPTPDRAVVGLAMAGFFLHARTDNVLIATTAVTFFAWIAAIGMRARMDMAARRGVCAGG